MGFYTCFPLSACFSFSGKKNKRRFLGIAAFFFSYFLFVSFSDDNENEFVFGFPLFMKRKDGKKQENFLSIFNYCVVFSLICKDVTFFVFILAWGHRASTEIYTNQPLYKTIFCYKHFKL